MKPKVLQVVTSFLPRTEVFIYHYLISLTEIESHVLAESRENEKEFPLDHIHIIPVPQSRKSSLWLKSKFHQLLTGYSLRQSRIEKLCRMIPFDVIHAHFGPNGYQMLPVKKKFNIPLVTTFYGYDMSLLPREKEWQKKYKLLFEEGDLFLVEGPYMQQRLIDIGAPSGKVQIQRIAIKLDQYPKWKPANEAPTVLFVGRFVEKKGLIYALQAAFEVKKEILNLQFRIIGDGPEREKIMQFISDHQMQSYTHLLGMKSHNDSITEMSHANVFIQPSITAENGDSEGGAPTTLLEAQAIGIPIVSTYHADIPNIVGKSDGIYLCEEKNAAALASLLKAALHRKEPTHSSFVQENHNVLLEAKKLEEKYLKLFRHATKDQTICQ